MDDDFIIQSHRMAYKRFYAIPGHTPKQPPPKANIDQLVSFFYERERGDRCIWREGDIGGGRWGRVYPIGGREIANLGEGTGSQRNYRPHIDG